MISVVEGRFTKGVIVPFDTSNFTSFTTNTRSDVDVLADFFLTTSSLPWYWTGMTRDLLNLKGARVTHLYAFSIFTRKPLNSGVYAFGSIAAGES